MCEDALFPSLELKTVHIEASSLARCHSCLPGTLLTATSVPRTRAKTIAQGLASRAAVVLHTGGCRLRVLAPYFRMLSVGLLWLSALLGGLRGKLSGALRAFAHGR